MSKDPENPCHDGILSLKDEVFNAMATQVAVVDEFGEFVAMNQAWRDSWIEKEGGSSQNLQNFLSVVVGTESAGTLAVSRAIRDVLELRSSKEEFICGSKLSKRKAHIHGVAKSIPVNGRRGAVIALHEISDFVNSWSEESPVGLIARTMRSAVVLTDENKLITWVNDAFTNLTGYAREEVLGRSPGSLLQCEDTDQDTIQEMRAALKAQVPFRGRILNVAKHGRRYWLDLDIQPRLDAFGDLIGFLAIENDVTALVESKERAESAYRDITAYRSATENHALVSIADRTGKIIDVNKGFCRISGYEAEELLGQDHRILNSGKHPKSFWTEMWSTVRAGQTWRAEVCNRAKDGSLYWVDSTIVPSMGADGKPERYVSIRFDITARVRATQQAAEAVKRVEQRTAELFRANQDLNAEITERRRAEEELARTHRDLVEAARKAGMAEIATGVLHNVGNVLNSVNISASTIGEHLRSPKRQQLGRVLELLESNRERLGEYLAEDERGKHVPALLAKLLESLAANDQELIGETQSLAKNIDHIRSIIATQQSLASSSGLLEVLDLNAVIEDALRLNATSFTKHSVTVTRELSDLPAVVLDKQRLMQIVVNLIKNAKEALCEHAIDDKVLTLRSYSSDGSIVVEVADNGVGIPADGLVKIFTHGYTTKKNGHGFGLHSCANAAREMGGELTVTSKGHMQGASFLLTLPMKVHEPPESAPQQELTGAQ